jgi:nucleotide-binding universal stress UspA family protein
VTYETILVATDGSEWTERAVAHALGLADTYGAAVHALSVFDARALSLDDEGFVADEGVVEALERRCTRAVEEVCRRAEARGLDCTTAVERGGPAATIRRYADDSDADLVAMGTRGRGRVARRLLGSVAGSVLARSRRPVLTARTARSDDAAGAAVPTDTDYDDVLVPTDGSPGGDRAVEHAVDVADRYGARIHALSVIDTDLIVSPLLLSALEAESERALSAVEERAGEAGVDAVTRVWRGTPAECIRGYAERHGVDLIAMGTHERRGLDRFLTRTVAERVVPRVDPPVLSVPAPASGDGGG